MNPTRQSQDNPAGAPLSIGLKIAAAAGLTALAVFQAWAYYNRMQLLLSPRAVLQPWLIARGFIMYHDIIDLHAPLMPMILSFFVPLFPAGITLAKTAVVLLVTLSTLLTFEMGRRATGWFGGLWAAWFFVVWSPAFVFFMLWHESFLAPIYVIWLFFHQPSGKSRSVMNSLLLGCSGGIAVLIKQHAAVPFAAAVLWNVFTRRRFRSPIRAILRETGWILLGAALPVAAFGIHHLLQAGSLKECFFWTVQFNLAGEYKTIALSRPTIAQIGILVSCLLVLPAAVCSLVDAKRRGDPVWLRFGLMILLLVTGSVTAYPKFAFFHLQPVLSMIALTSVLTFAYALSRSMKTRFFTAAVMFSLSVFWFVTAGHEYRPVIKPETSQPIWQYSPLEPLAAQIQKIVPSNQRLYIFPDNEMFSNLYYILRAEPPRYWVLHYPWYALDDVRLRILKTLNDSPPDWIIRFPDRYGFVERAPDIDRFIQTHYRPDAVVTWQWGEVQLLRRIGRASEGIR